MPPSKVSSCFFIESASEGLAGSAADATALSRWPVSKAKILLNASNACLTPSARSGSVCIAAAYLVAALAVPALASTVLVDAT